MSQAPLVVIGDLLLDREVVGTVDRLCPEVPAPVLVENAVYDRPGGAGLAALFTTEQVPRENVETGWAATGGRPKRPGRPGCPEVVLIAAVGRDPAAERLRELLASSGVRLIALPYRGPTPEKIRMRAGDHVLIRLDRGDLPGVVGPAPDEALQAVASAGAILVSDYGRGVSARPELRAAVSAQTRRAPVVWDPHPRGDRPVAGTRLVTPNLGEAARFVAAPADGHHGGAAGVDGARARTNGVSYRPGKAGATRPLDGADPELAKAATGAVALRGLWSADAVAVTVAERGAVLSAGSGPPLLVPVPFRARGDSCGAGDRFASAALAALSAGCDLTTAVAAAVDEATAYVAAGGALGCWPQQHGSTGDPGAADTTGSAGPPDAAGPAGTGRDLITIFAGSLVGKGRTTEQGRHPGADPRRPVARPVAADRRHNGKGSA